MIDFKNGSFVKLNPVSNNEFASLLSPLLVPGEDILFSFKTIRDGVVFTGKRIITINVQNLTGRKKDFTSIPYNKIQLYSVETAGTLDLDSELILWLSGTNSVKFEFTRGTNVYQLCQIISRYIL